ncbi:MAG: hypothetical protein PHU14_00075 [Methylovulum sp.]|nr:hypothetical protein [Methylovulum sp.]
MAKNNTSPFIEAIGVEGQASGLKWLIRVIKAGKSGNNNFYPDAALREAAPLFAGVRVFVKSDAEHIAGQGKSFEQLIGQLSEPRFIEGKTPDTGEIQATLTLLASAGDVPAKLREAYDAKMDGLFGFSIDADAQVKKRGTLREATKFTKVHSVDLIIDPGAGGELIRLLEAMDGSMPLTDLLVSAIKVANGGDLPPGLDITNNEALLAAYNATLDTDDGCGSRYYEANTKGTDMKNNTSPDAADLLAEKIRLVEARAEARHLLKSCNLPEPVVAKLSKQFGDNAEFTVEQVREAINDERAMLAKLTESGHVQGLGDTRVEAGADRSEKVNAMLDDFFNPNKRAFSFRECYAEITGDRGVTGLVQNCDVRRLQEALGGDEHFREAISASTFSNILGDSITRAMVRDYNALENYNDYINLVDIVPISNFRTQERTRMGGYGNLPTVAENGPYTALTSPSDEKSTYAISKRGGKETISLETIANDDVGAIRKVPLRLATAAKRTLFEFVLNFLANNPTIYDASTLFHAVNHSNLGTAALDNTSFAAARLAIKSQTEAGSNKPLGLVLRHLYVPAELEEQAFNMFVRGTNLDETFVQSRKPTVHVVDYWNDVNNWYATADKMETPLIELGFYNGNEEPELFVQDMPTQGSLFSNDQIVYKIRHIYGGNVLDYRGFYGAVVA